eukprot:6209366-Pleurochrysis_carterae.AAC.7
MDGESIALVHACASTADMQTWLGLDPGCSSVRHTARLGNCCRLSCCHAAVKPSIDCEGSVRECFEKGRVEREPLEIVFAYGYARWSVPRYILLRGRKRRDARCKNLD